MENKKHILFISSWYPNRNNPTHGIFNRYFAEAAALHNRVSILHVCSDDHISVDFEFGLHEEEKITTQHVYYKKVTSRTPLISQLKKRKMLIDGFELGYKKIVEKNGTPDLIQLNVIMPSGIGALHLAKKYHIPFVINEGWSGYCPEDGSYKGFLQKYMTKKIADAAEVLMPVSNYLKQAMLSHDLTGHYEIVPNVVDIHIFTPQPKQPSERTSYLHISTLDDVQKNVSGIIRAFAAACKINHGIELIIIGEGPERQALQWLAVSQGVAEKITFKGSLSIPEIVKAINASDALVMFSNYETFSLVVAEAFACGKPVITSRAGGLTDMVTPDLGIAIEKKNEAQLTEALVHFAGNKSHYDPLHIRHFVTEQFSKEKISEQLNQVYEEVLVLNKTMTSVKQP